MTLRDSDWDYRTTLTALLLMIFGPDDKALTGMLSYTGFQEVYTPLGKEIVNH